MHIIWVITFHYKTKQQKPKNLNRQRKHICKLNLVHEPPEYNLWFTYDHLMLVTKNCPFPEVECNVIQLQTLLSRLRTQSLNWLFQGHSESAESKHLYGLVWCYLHYVSFKETGFYDLLRLFKPWIKPQYLEWLQNPENLHILSRAFSS